MGQILQERTAWCPRCRSRTRQALVIETGLRFFYVEQWRCKNPICVRSSTGMVEEVCCIRTDDRTHDEILQQRRSKKRRRPRSLIKRKRTPRKL